MYKGVHSKAARVIKGEEKNQVRNRSEFPQKGALVLTVGGRRMAYLNTSGINMGCLWLLVHVCYLHVSVLPNICSLSLQVKLTKTIVDSTLNKGMYQFVFGRIGSDKQQIQQRLIVKTCLYPHFCRKSYLCKQFTAIPF